MLQRCEDTVNEFLRPAHEKLVLWLHHLIGKKDRNGGKAAGDVSGVEALLRYQGLPFLVASTAFLVVLVWLLFGLWVSKSSIQAIKILPFTCDIISPFLLLSQGLASIVTGVAILVGLVIMDTIPVEAIKAAIKEEADKVAAASPHANGTGGQRASPGPIHPLRRDFSLYGATVKVTDFRVVEKDYASYRIAIQCKGQAWSVWRRFSEFANLRDSLSLSLTSPPPSPSSGEKKGSKPCIPPLPSKTMFIRLDFKFLQERWVGGIGTVSYGLYSAGFLMTRDM